MSNMNQPNTKLENLDNMFSDLFNSNIHDDIESQPVLINRSRKGSSEVRRKESVQDSLNRKSALNTQITSRYEQEVLKNLRLNGDNRPYTEGLDPKDIELDSLMFDSIMKSMHVETAQDNNTFNSYDLDNLEVQGYSRTEDLNEMALLEAETNFDEVGQGPEYTTESIYESTLEPEGEHQSDNGKCVQEQHSMDMRKKFINRLEQNGIKQQSSGRFTTFIFDWDDTLLCTTFLNKKTKGLPRTPASQEKLVQYLNSLSDVVCAVLQKARTLGKVYLITNAVKNWIDQSSNKWLPQTVDLLREVELISARQKFEAKQPKQLAQWKTQTFLELTEQFHTDELHNIIVVGDSVYEIEGAKKMKEQFTNCFLKTVKLKEMPHPEELINQLQLVLNNMESIVTKPKDLTIKLAKKE